jgi:bifunctional UDP-N-acetylglucosamine pyrophosphorylase/glucosamine-1-phosphate N-acetyltransferase
MTDQSFRSDSSALAAVILAAGDSKRMKSTLTKVLHPLAGLPMILHVIRTVETEQPEKIVIVVGKNREAVEQTVENSEVELADQDEPLGTAHALLSARDKLKAFEGDLLVLCGDTPLIQSETICNLVDFHRREGCDATLLTCRFEDPFGYGRIVRAEDGTISRIVEEKEATDLEKAIMEVNTAIYCLKTPAIFDFLEEICAGKTDKEYYLTDIVEIYNREGLKVNGLSIDDEFEVMGINTRNQLSTAESTLRERIRNHWMREGVTLIDPASIFIDSGVKIGNDTTIYPFVMLEGDSRVGAGSTIGPYSRIIDSRIGRGSRLMGWNYLVEASIPEGETLQLYSSHSPR